MDPISDDYLVQAARRRILRELEREADYDRIVNNVYGGGGTSGGAATPSGPGGMVEALSGENDPFDYFVDITRRDVRAPDEIDPNTGEPIPHSGKLLGWDKKVHRFRSEKTPRGAYGKKKGPKAGMMEGR